MSDEELTSLSLIFQSMNDGSVMRCGASIASLRCAINYERVEPKSDVICGSTQRRAMFTVLVYLSDYGGHDMWCDTRHMALPFQSEGMIGLYDREHFWKSRVRNPLNCVQFHFPKSRLDQLSGSSEGRSIELLSDVPAKLSLFDPILKYLALASIPLLNSQGPSRTTYIEQVMDAVVAHVGRTYCDVREKSTFDRDRLAPWQLRKVNSTVSSNIEGKLSVEDLAGACSLSPSHFSYLFKNTTGCTPHQWLLDRRIELAKKLLRGTDESLVGIASAAGFSDQSHFTRVFSRRVKASPSAWRREELARVLRIPSDGAAAPVAGHV